MQVKLSEIKFSQSIKANLNQLDKLDLPFESPKICPWVRQAMLVHIPHRLGSKAKTTVQRQELQRLASQVSQWLREKPVNLQTLSRRLLFERIAWMTSENDISEDKALNDYWQTTQLVLELRQKDDQFPLNPASLDRGPVSAIELAGKRLTEDIMAKYGIALNQTCFLSFIERMGIARELKSTRD